MVVKLKLTNIGAIGSGDFELGPGVNAVIGPNGSGKSTLVGALYFALTGETLNGSTLDSLITWGCTSGSVELTIGKLVITRTVSKNSAAKVKFVNGSVILNRAKEVNQAICEYYGFADLTAALSTVYFARQYDLDLVDAADSVRLQLMTSLLGFHRLEKLRESLRKAISLLDVSEVSADVLTQMRSALKSAEAYRDEILTRLNALQGSLLSSEDREAYLRVVDAPLKGTMDSLKESSDTLTAKLESIVATLSSLPKPPTAKDHADAFGVERHKSLSKDMLEAQEILVKLKARRELSPEAIAGFLDRVTKSTFAAQSKRDRINSHYALLKGGACPLTGGDPCPDLLAMTNKDALDAQIAEIDAELAQYAQDDAAMRAMLATSQQLEKDILAAESDLHMIESSLQSITLNADFDLDDYRTRVAAADAVQQQVSTLTTSKAAIESELSQVQAEIHRLESLGSIECSQEMKEEAIARLKHDSDSRAKIEAVQLNVSGAEYQVAEQLEAVRFAEEQNARAAENKANAEFLGKIRSAFHRDNLPRLLMEDMLGTINQRLTHYLSRFSFPYAVQWTSAGSLLYTDGTGEWHRVSQLSGGQKYVLMLSIRCTLADLIGSKFPLMILDEPTTGLDVVNREYLSEVIFNFAAQNPNLVLVIPTHDDMLLPSANVISI